MHIQTDEEVKRPTIRTDSLSTEAREKLDQVILSLNEAKDEFANKVTVKELIKMMEDAVSQGRRYADRFVIDDAKSRQRSEDSWDVVSSYIAGSALILRLTQIYLRVLKEIDKYGKPKAYTKLTKNIRDQWVVQTFPNDLYDRLVFSGVTQEVLMKPFVSKEKVIEDRARVYPLNNMPGSVSLILSAGNYSVISVVDALYKLINKRQVVLIKLHPVKEYFGEYLEKIFRRFVERGYLRIVQGGVDVGTYLCHHRGIDEVHMTGSDKTFEAVVFGAGEEGQKNKMKNLRINNKVVTGELGCISPVIVVPGPWKKSELEFQAKNIVSSMVYNSGFSCNATRVMIQQKQWGLRDQLLDEIKRHLDLLKTDKAYYPGSENLIREALKTYPNAFTSGDFNDGHTPWVFATDLDSRDKGQMAFKREIFGSFLSETALDTDSVVNYIDEAVKFCNNNLWGTLNAMIIVHPKSLKDLKVNLAVERAISNLKYGTVCVNNWPGFSYYIGYGTWGGFPGTTDNDIQSGNIIVMNPNMFEHVQKTVCRFPFIRKPDLNPYHKNILEVSKRLVDYEGKRSLWSLLKLIAAFLRT